MKKQDLTSTFNLVKLNSDILLSKYDFKLSNEQLEKNYIEFIYRKEDLYVKFEVSFHPRDFPYYFRIILGEGSLDFPESDWNSTALWRIGQLSNPSSQAGYYTIENISDVKEILNNALEDLENIGADFLQGNLAKFIIARKNQNINREPYKMYSKNKDEKYQFEYDSKIVELKRKYT
ncbi:hypothetical protein [Epilithonimonas sp. UC225_85]|uniref:hypothetical protein n=1 Tax=Epilithonimonas sp. UC225_85 TaxID=3350167 RepID=UPI0036D2C6D9